MKLIHVSIKVRRNIPCRCKIICSKYEIAKRRHHPHIFNSFLLVPSKLHALCRLLRRFHVNDYKYYTAICVIFFIYKALHTTHEMHITQFIESLWLNANLNFLCVLILFQIRASAVRCAFRNAYITIAIRHLSVLIGMMRESFESSKQNLTSTFFFILPKGVTHNCTSQWFAESQLNR